MRWNRDWCRLRHAHTRLYHDKVSRLPSSTAINSFRELHSHTSYKLYPSPRRNLWMMNSWSITWIRNVTRMIQTILENLMGRDYLEDAGINFRIISKCCVQFLQSLESAAILSPWHMHVAPNSTLTGLKDWKSTFEKVKSRVQVITETLV